MKITKIEPQKHSTEKYNIYVDGEYSFSLSTNTIAKEKLCVGLDLPLAQLQAYVKEDENEKAFIYIIDYLSYGDRTTLEIKKQLQKKGYSPEAVDMAVQKAVDASLLNDERYCDHFVYSKLNSSKPDGPQKIMSQLILKGIPKDLIREKIDEYLVHGSEQDKIEALAKKKIPTIKYKNKYDLKSKLFRFIAQKGFNTEDIKAVIDRIIDDYCDGDSEEDTYYE